MLSLAKIKKNSVFVSCQNEGKNAKTTMFLMIVQNSFQVIVVGLQKGWDSSREEFFYRFFKAVRITHSDSTYKIKEGRSRKCCLTEKKIHSIKFHVTAIQGRRRSLTVVFLVFWGTSSCCIFSYQASLFSGDVKCALITPSPPPHSLPRAKFCNCDTLTQVTIYQLLITLTSILFPETTLIVIR